MKNEEKCEKKIKYEMVGEGGLYRIKALKSFGGIKKGEIGGLISNEKNLSHSGNAWVFSNAKVLGDAVVADNAKILGYAVVSGNAVVSGDAEVSKSPCINLFLHFNITIMDNHIQIGCELKTIQEWKNLPMEWVENNYPLHTVWWEKVKPILFSIEEARKIVTAKNG
jgi:hypothetical protein